MTDTRVSTIVFDIGNVLLDWDPRHLYSKIFAREEEMEWFLDHVCTQDWIRELDRGRPVAEAVAEQARLFPDYALQIRAFDTRWQETLNGEIEGSVRLLEVLHERGAPIYALTNFSAEKFHDTCPRYDFFERFRGVLVSGEERLIKPDPAISRLMLERFDLKAAECLFIDDNLDNVWAAQNLGLKAVRFENPSQLEKSLRGYGFL
jgi:2-haloacid dehalogenase